MEQIALYYATRFPEADIWFSNSGQSGDVVPGAMRRLADDAELRATLRSKGLVRAAEFCWAKTADMIVRSIRGENLL